MHQVHIPQQGQPALSRPPSIVHQHRLSPALQTNQPQNHQHHQPHQHPSPYHSPNLVTAPHHNYPQQHQQHSAPGHGHGHGQEGYQYVHQTSYATPAPSHYSAASTPELMAAAHLQRPSYAQAMYHTPQSTSPTSVASQPSHDYRMYNQTSSQLNQPLQYSGYPTMNQVPAYSHHPGQGSAPGHGLAGQPMLLSHQQGQPPMPHQAQGNVNTSPRQKLEPPLHRSMDLPRSQAGSIASPVATNSSVGGGHQSTGGGGSGNSSAAPGPIPATTPLVVRQDGNGVQWIAFEYSRDRVKMEYTIRCDVESVDVDHLDPTFKTDNCVYPRACCSKDFYKGNRFNYETECNTVGWALAELNPCLRGKRGLIQRAVDSWRNSNSDPKLRSRRVRRQAKQDKRHSSRGGGHMSGGLMGPMGMQRPPSMVAPMSRPMGLGPQLHHHHTSNPDGAPHSGPEDVSGMFQHHMSN